MKHPFYHQDDDNFVETVLAGYVEFEPGQLRIRTLRLVTDGATYGVATDRTQFFGAAARSVP
jgi:hypothetical protein